MPAHARVGSESQRRKVESQPAANAELLTLEIKGNAEILVICLPVNKSHVGGYRHVKVSTLQRTYLNFSTYL